MRLTKVTSCSKNRLHFLRSSEMPGCAIFCYLLYKSQLWSFRTCQFSFDLIFEWFDPIFYVPHCCTGRILNRYIHLILPVLKSVNRHWINVFCSGEENGLPETTCQQGDDLCPGCETETPKASLFWLFFLPVVQQRALPRLSTRELPQREEGRG